jgi:putative copper export protein
MSGAATRGVLQRDGAAQPGFHRGLRSLGLVASGLFVFTLACKLWTQAAGFADPGAGVTTEDLATFAFRTPWGRAWEIQLLLGIVAFTTFLAPWHGRIATTLRVAFAGTAAFSVPATGHAAAHVEQWPAALLAQGAHVVAAGVWLGTLATMILVPGGGMEVWRRFSRIAQAGTAVVVSTGLWRVLQSLDGIAGLWQTGWGRTLMLKLLLVALTGAVGLLNWRASLPAAVRVGHVTPALRRRVVLELTFAVATFAVTGWLAGQAPGGG